MCKVWTNVFKLPQNKATLSGLLAKLTNNKSIHIKRQSHRIRNKFVILQDTFFSFSDIRIIQNILTIKSCGVGFLVNLAMVLAAIRVFTGCFKEVKIADF